MFDYTKTIINAVKAFFASELGKVRSGLEKLIASVQAAADKALTKAKKAQTTADAAQTTADAAQTTADAAQTTADAAQTTADAALPKSGGTLTGSLILKGEPTKDKEAVTKRYADEIQTAANMSAMWPLSREENIVENAAITINKGDKLGDSIKGYHPIYGEKYTSNGPYGETHDEWSGNYVTIFSPVGTVDVKYENGQYSAPFGNIAATSVTFTGKFIKAPSKTQYSRYFYGVAPYAVFPFILMESDSKLFRITVDDSGTLSATEVTS